jgi:diacylglycerol O-acyltransferase / wax synthase
MPEPGTRAAGVDLMSGADALLWAIGDDPVMRPTIVALMVLDGTPAWSEVAARVERLTRAVPRLRSRVVVRAPGRGRPQFVVDPAFELSTHVRRIRLPDGCGIRDVLDLAQTMATSGFDTALPLWEAVFVEEVGGEASVLVMKVHHSLIDGVGGLAVLAQLFDHAASAGTGTGKKAGKAGKALSNGRKPEAGRRRSRFALPDAGRLAGDIVGAALHPVRTAGRAAALGSSVARLMAPAAHPVSPLMTGRSFRRRVEVLDLDLDTLKRAATDWGATVNDVFVASVVRGTARYHDQQGMASPGFRVLMPVNVRSSDDPVGGNHFVPARFVVPVHMEVADCVAEVKSRAGQWKQAPGLEVSDVLAAGLSTLPPPLARGLWSTMLLGDDFCITNVPGPPFQPSFAGVGVTSIYALSPPSGAAFNAALVSVGDRACITINVDVAAVADVPKLAGCIEDGFTEVCSAARPPRRRRRQGSRPGSHPHSHSHSHS